uniref:Uncharacterized protein n=1 Tax=Moniliophthora roreri TaxID=221103 RepID=A0A0W0FZN2_MONRR
MADLEEMKIEDNSLKIHTVTEHLKGRGRLNHFVKT